MYIYRCHEIREPIIIQNHDLMRAVDVTESRNSCEFVERLKQRYECLVQCCYKPFACHPTSIVSGRDSTEWHMTFTFGLYFRHH